MVKVKAAVRVEVGFEVAVGAEVRVQKYRGPWLGANLRSLYGCKALVATSDGALRFRLLWDIVDDGWPLIGGCGGRQVISIVEDSEMTEMRCCSDAVLWLPGKLWSSKVDDAVEEEEESWRRVRESDLDQLIHIQSCYCLVK
jgi:hypothetical protein